MKNKNYISVCSENPQGCSFQIMHYPQGAQRSSVDLEQHLLLFCQSGHISIKSNFFENEFLCAGEILFIPRGSDYHGVALSDATVLVHYFNNGICHIENCILIFSIYPQTYQSTSREELLFQ